MVIRLVFSAKISFGVSSFNYDFNPRVLISLVLIMYTPVGFVLVSTAVEFYS